jgi:hypothetical protein
MFTKRFTPPLTLYTNHQPHPSRAVYHNPSLSYCIAPTMVHSLPCCILQAPPFHIAYLQPLTPLLYISDPSLLHISHFSHPTVYYRSIPPILHISYHFIPYILYTVYTRPLPSTLNMLTNTSLLCCTHIVYTNPFLLCCTMYSIHQPLPPKLYRTDKSPHYHAV